MSDIVTRYAMIRRNAIDNNELNEQGIYPNGKFQGQTPITMAFYNLARNGGSDEHVTSVTGQLAGFRLSDAEMLQLDLRRYVIIAQDNMGHITLQNYDTEEAYRARMHEVSEPEE